MPMSLYLCAVIGATLASQAQVLDWEYPFEVYQQHFNVKFSQFTGWSKSSGMELSP